MRGLVVENEIEKKRKPPLKLSSTKIANHAFTSFGENII